MRLFLGAIFFIILSFQTSAQSVFAPYNADYNHLLERYEIKSGQFSNDFHSNFKSIRRKDVVKLATEIEINPKANLSKVDSFNLKYLQNDSWEWLEDSLLHRSDSKKSFLKYFLKKQSDFYSKQTKDFDFHASPIFNFMVGNDNLVEKQPSINTRGIEIRGTLNRRLGFYSMFTENQVIYPQYVRDFSNQNDAFPYEGFTKVTNEDSTRLLTDFFSARGYITFQALKSLQVQFGHDKNFIGSGVRSMILSDFSAPYLHLKLITQLGRFQYINIFAQASNKQVILPVDNTQQIPPKYFSLHHLSINLTKNLNVGLFENVIFGKRNVGFDINYLNPVIFLRYVEGHLGSTDNSVVGIDAKYNFLRSFSLYSQFVLDEFRLSDFKRKGWWGKKYAGQFGGRYIDAFKIKNLDFQAEYNFARPYTYSHFSSYSNYVHYNLSLAHPLGANFNEMIFIARYQPINRLSFVAALNAYKKGEDKDILNWGGDILRNNRDYRPDDENNTIGQGEVANVKFFDFTATYMLKHNLFIDLKLQRRVLDKTDDTKDQNNNIISFGVRWNTWQKNLVF